MARNTQLSEQPPAPPPMVRRKHRPVDTERALAFMEQAVQAERLLSDPATKETDIPTETATAYMSRVVDIMRSVCGASFAAMLELRRDGTGATHLTSAKPAISIPMGGQAPDRETLRDMAKEHLKTKASSETALYLQDDHEKPQALVLFGDLAATAGGQERRLLNLLAEQAGRALGAWRRRRAENTSRKRMAGEQARLQARAGLAADAFFEVDHRGRISAFVALSPPLRADGAAAREKFVGLDLHKAILSSEAYRDDNEIDPELALAPSLADAIERGISFRDLEVTLPSTAGGNKISVSGAPVNDGTITTFAGCFTMLDGHTASAHQRRDLLEMVNRLERARARERSLRRETETLLEGLRILTKPIPSTQVFEGLLALLRGSLGFDGAALIRRDWQGGLVAAIASNDGLTQLDWPRIAKRAGGLPTDPELLERHSPILTALNDQTQGEKWRSALVVHLTIENQPAWLMCLHHTPGFFDNAGLGLASRLALLANQALMNEAEKNKAIQSAKLATLGEMAAGIAHEMNQPLAAISLAAQNLELILEDEPPDLPFAQTKVERIQAQTDRASRIVSHMRVFARQSYDHDQSFVVSRQVAEVLGIVGEQLRNHDIEFNQSYESPEPTVKGDPLQFEQVLINVLTNARDAIDAYRESLRETGQLDRLAGKISLTLETVPGMDNETGPKVRVRIADNGGGIPEDIAEQLFDPFFTTKDVGKGTGLGLSISYGIMRDMGGTISISNGEEGAMVDLILSPQTGPVTGSVS